MAAWRSMVRRGLGLMGLGLMGMAALGGGGAALALPTLADYGDLPTVSNVEISPEGDKIALIVGAAGDRQLQIRNEADNAIVFLAKLGSAKIRGLEWAGEHHLLVISSVTAQPFGLLGPQREYFQVSDLNLDRKRLRPLLGDTQRSLNTINSMPVVLTLDGRPVVFVQAPYFPTSHGVNALFRIDLDTDISRLVAEGRETTQGFLVGPDGQAVARSDYAQTSGRWTLSIKSGWGWKEAYTETAPIDVPALISLGHDGQSALLRVHDERGADILREVSLKDGALSAPLSVLNLKGVVEDPLTHQAIGGVTTTMEHSVYTFFSPKDQAAWDMVSKAFKRQELKLVSWSDDRKMIIVKVEGAPYGAAFFVVNMRTGAAEELVDEYAGVAPEDVAEQQVIAYAAADGLKVPAYLTLPQHRPAKRLPLVVLVHGGPAARDEPGFDWWAQALASRGYAVLQPQYRGSAGLGAEHERAGFGQWGRKMQTDLSDGVRALAARGVIDPQRVCIMGGSYGGYAALAAATFDPDVYRCAVDLAGLSDLGRFLDYERDKTNDRDEELLRYWDRFMGAAPRSERTLDAVSPALHADKAAIPILLIHGKDDTVVPYAQSTEMLNALKQARKSAELVTLKGEDHWLSRGETRLQMLTAAVDFLEKHNPPDAAAAGQEAITPAATPSSR